MKSTPSRLDAYFTVEPGGEIPGHLILRTQPPVLQLDKLPAPALAALGPWLSRAMAAITRTVQPERIYILRFGEEVEAIHFHLFPRTRVMGDLYRQMHPAATSISGAQMFDWARRPDLLARLSFPSSADQAFDAILHDLR